MATQTQEFKAKSVDEAIAEGLEVLGVAQDAVEIEIINKGSRGIFGIGSEPAVVRLTLRSAAPVEATSVSNTAVSDDTLANDTEIDSSAEVIPTTASSSKATEGTQAVDVQEESASIPPVTMADNDIDSIVADQGFADEDEDESSDDGDEEYEDEDGESNTTDDEDDLAAMASDMLDEMIHLMGFKADVNATWFDDEDDDEYDDEDDDEETTQQRRRYLRLDVEGTDLGALIGRRGETLENIQYLLRLMINQKIHRWKNIIVDVEHYKERRVNQLTQLAERMADQVAHSGRAISLEPMPANERRIIHMVLRNHPDVYTESYGDGPRRKVHIFLRD